MENKQLIKQNETNYKNGFTNENLWDVCTVFPGIEREHRSPLFLYDGLETRNNKIRY